MFTTLRGSKPVDSYDTSPGTCQEFVTLGSSFISRSVGMVGYTQAGEMAQLFKAGLETRIIRMVIHKGEKS